MADFSSLDGYKAIIDLLKNDNITDYPDLKLNIERIQVFWYLTEIM